MLLGRINDYAGGLSRAAEAIHEEEMALKERENELREFSLEERVALREEIFTEAAELIDVMMAAPESAFLGAVAVNKENDRQTKREVRDLVPGLGALVITRLKEFIPKEEAKALGDSIWWGESAGIVVPDHIANAFGKIKDVASVSLVYPTHSSTPGVVAGCEKGLETIRTFHDVWNTTERIAVPRAQR